MASVSAGLSFAATCCRRPASSAGLLSSCATPSLRPPSPSFVESYCTIIEQGKRPGLKHYDHGILPYFFRLPRQRPASTLVFLSPTLMASVCLAGIPRVSLSTASTSSLFATFSLQFTCREVLTCHTHGSCLSLLSNPYPGNCTSREQ